MFSMGLEPVTVAFKVGTAAELLRLDMNQMKLISIDYSFIQFCLGYGKTYSLFHVSWITLQLSAAQLRMVSV